MLLIHSATHMNMFQASVISTLSYYWEARTGRALVAPLPDNRDVLLIHSATHMHMLKARVIIVLSYCMEASTLLHKEHISR